MRARRRRATRVRAASSSRRLDGHLTVGALLRYSLPLRMSCQRCLAVDGQQLVAEFLQRTRCGECERTRVCGDETPHITRFCVP